MARIRTLKPEFWTDGKVVGLPFESRLLFMGAWNFTRCDQGHLDDDPVALKLKVLPADDIDAHASLEALVSAGLLDRYEADGRTFLHIRRFTEHQKIETRWNSRCPYCPLQDSANPTEPRRTSPKLADTRANSPQEGKGREGKGRDRKTHTPSDDGFEVFWKQYPLRTTGSGSGSKGSKKNALAAWKKLSPEQRAKALSSLPAYVQAKNGYPKDAERYLKSEEWDGLENVVQLEERSAYQWL